MTSRSLAEMRERASATISIAHNRVKLAKDLAAARADVLALVTELEAYRAAHEREFLPSAKDMERRR
jgi:hypothetical protein